MLTDAQVYETIDQNLTPESRSLIARRIRRQLDVCALETGAKLSERLEFRTDQRAQIRLQIGGAADDIVGR